MSDNSRTPDSHLGLDSFDAPVDWPQAIRRLRAALDCSQADLRTELRQAARAHEGREAAVTVNMVGKWETGQKHPSAPYRRLLRRVAEKHGISLTTPAVGHLQLTADERLEVLELARQAESSDLGSGTLETIDRTVDRFCRAYPSASPRLLIPDVGVRLGDLSRLLRGRVTLTQHRALLVAGGWLATLLACLQFDLGDREAAEASRDAAYQLAKEGGHQELMAWTFELLAWFALVDGRYRDTVDLAQAGRELAPNTSAGVQLAVQEAKAWSRLRDRRGADAALAHAETVLSRLPAPSHSEHHFVFDPTKLSFYASTCYTWLGEDEQAEEHARHVIAQCLDTPGVVRWPMRLAANRVDLGLIAARRGQVDEAAHLGAQAVASKRKSGDTLNRVAELNAALLRDYPDAPEAQELYERYMAARRAFSPAVAT